MAFDPTLPADHAPILSAELRGQFTGLKSLIDAVPAGPPGPGLDFLGDWDGGTLYAPGEVIFHGGQAFVCIAAVTGTPPEGDPAHWRTLTIAGPPGEVTAAQMSDFVVPFVANELANAIADTPHNPSAVSDLNLTVSDPPQQGEVQAVADKLDQLLTALRRS